MLTVPRRLAGVVSTFLTVLALLAVLAPREAEGQAAAPTVTLTLEEAVARAMDRNPTVLVPAGEEDAALWSVRAARASLLPSASVSGGISWQGSGEERLGSLTSGELGQVGQPNWYFSQYSAGLSYTLNGTALLAPREARAGVQLAAARTEAARATLRLEVTRAYLAALQRDEAIRLADSELERARANLRLAEARSAVGAVTDLDVRQAEVSVGRAQVSLIREEGEARNARIALLLLLGEEPGSVELELTSRFPLRTIELDEEELVDAALGSHPDLARLRAQEEQARVSVRSARSQYLPTLSAQAGWSGFTRQASNSGALVAQAEAGALNRMEQCELQNQIFSRLADPLPTQNCRAFAFDDATRAAILDGNRAFPFDFTRQPPSMGVSLSIPVFQGLQRQRQVESARVSLRSARLQEEERSRSLRGDVLRGVTSFRTALQAARLEEENREVAESQLRLAREQYEAGLVDFIQLAEAENIRARAEREYLSAVYSVHEALAGLEALVGDPIITR